jgi:nicotinamidase-related amidase
MTNTALLVMDVQDGVVARHTEGMETLLATLGQAVNAARSAGVPVIYVRVAFRAGAPEVNDRNRIFSSLATYGGMNIDDPGAEIHPAVVPRPEDIVVVKKRVSVFTGSDLEIILRSLDVTALVLTGIATSGVVLSTLRQAVDLDYSVTVLRDGCADADPEVHRVLLDKVFSRQATVLMTDEWVNGLVAESPPSDL